jgi:Asp-tRNA(Asn)/Glu-tRNA(Gln) amidotransferase A subunit family amidase
LVVGVPDASSRPLLTDGGAAALETDAAALAREGHDVVRVDLGVAFAAGDLLYGGAWLAERTAAVAPLLRGEDVDDVVRAVVERGRAYSGVEVFEAIARLDELRREVALSLWTELDVLVVPTVPTVPTLAAVAADPIGVNTQLGRYTTFANLLGLAAVTVPRGHRTDGTPASATVLGPRGTESAIARAALDLERAAPAGTA